MSRPAAHQSRAESRSHGIREFHDKSPQALQQDFAATTAACSFPGLPGPTSLSLHNYLSASGLISSQRLVAQTPTAKPDIGRTGQSNITDRKALNGPCLKSLRVSSGATGLQTFRQTVQGMVSPVPKLQQYYNTTPVALAIGLPY